MKKIIQTFLKLCLFLFLIANIMAAWHAYKFTHFKKGAVLISKSPESLTISQKVEALCTGVSLPRPETKEFPDTSFCDELVNNELACWRIDVPHSKGMVLLFHGYGSEKSSVIGKSQEFNRMGYSTFLVDFKGSGGSVGNTTTIGFKEANDVKVCYDFIAKQHPPSIILCGTSMGAAAILKCVHDTKIKPNGLILECPFGSMLQTVSNRFDSMGLPAFPLAHLLVFYGGIENGFWAFDNNPEDYAKAVKVPTLLLCGGADERVTMHEINSIFDHLNGKKQKIIYPNAKHESYLNDYRNEWRQDVICFLETEINKNS